MVMDPHGRPLTDYKCDGCQTINSCTKAYYVTHISDFVIIQLNIFKYVEGAIKKMIPTLMIDEEIYLWGNTITLHAIIYHVGQQANSGHYTSSVRVNDTWFLISDSRVLLEQPKLSFTHRDSSVPYILIYKKRTGVIIRTPISTNTTSDNNCASSTNEVDELLTPEMMMRHSLVKELNNQKEKIINANEQINSENSNQSSGQNKKTIKNDELNECVRKIKTHVKRKSKFSNSATKRSLSFRNKLDDNAKEILNKTTKKRVADLRAYLDDNAKEKLNKATKKRVANLRACLDDDAKEQNKDKDKERKKTVRDNLDDNAKEQILEKDKERKKTVRDNLDDDVKEQILEKDNKRKITVRDNLDDDAKEHIKDKKRKKTVRDNLDDNVEEKLNKATKKRVANLRDNLDDDAKVQIKDKDKERKKTVRDNLDDDAKEQILEKYNKRKITVHDNLDADAKEHIKDKKRKKTVRDNLDDNVKEKLNKATKKRVANLRDNLDDDGKEQILEKDKKRKKTVRDNLDDNAKEKLNKATKKRVADLRAYLDDDLKVQIKDKDKKMKKAVRDDDKRSRQEIFINVQSDSMVNPVILKTPAFLLVQQEFEAAIQEGPTYTCDICWKLEFKKNVIKLKQSKYDDDIYIECHTGKSEWICKNCHNSLLRKKMPMQAQANNLELCPKIEELEHLCPIELMLISQIIPFMFIVAKTKGAQNGLKGQCVLVPADLKKVQTILPRSCDEEYLISLALKRRLTDKSAVSTRVSYGTSFKTRFLVPPHRVALFQCGFLC